MTSESNRGSESKRPGARNDGRVQGELRPIEFKRHFTANAAGSVLTTFGRTQVLCSATYTDGVPPFMQGSGRGWLTAEYAMLPSATQSRKSRDRAGRIDGRSVEIQRLIGRALRSVMDLSKMTERTIWIDCDVLEADGGTRTVSINGAWVALHDLLLSMDASRLLRAWPLRSQVGAISVGVVGGETLCDLTYEEDSRADVDMNLVMNAEGLFIELQGAAEGAPFDRTSMESMVELGSAGIRRIFELQKAALES